MAKDSLYAVIPVELYELKQEEYIAAGFKNRGSVRVSLDGTKVLLEEAPDMFNLDDAEGYETLQLTEEECRQYLADNTLDWNEVIEDL